MRRSPFPKIAFFYRPGVKSAALWEKKILRWLKSRYPAATVLPSGVIPDTRRDAPNLLIVLGGDGTILEAAQKFQRWHPLIIGLNLGHVGFLASIRESKNFLKGLRALFARKYRTTPRMLIKAALMRGKRRLFSAYALNDVSIQNLLGMVDISVAVEGHPIQYIHGTGVLVATATGSTAYNLSAHGPIVMPDIKCLIITELLDHNIPTPSLVIKRNQAITLRVEDFRVRNKFIIKNTGEPADVILSLDNERIAALRKGDSVIVKKSERLVRLVELEKNYFFKSLREKFAFH